jgi:alpha,alpha-trehalose phosphorylase
MESGFGAAVFDMDGVVTRTAGLHAAAWKALFDELLRSREGPGFRPFDERADYLAYVDGKPRQAGVESFLRARGITASAEEKARLAERKDGLFELALTGHGVETFPSTLSLIRRLRSAGVKIGVVTSSRHGREILHRAGISRLFDARLDGIDLVEQRLKGKPDPEMFRRCAQALGVPPGRTLVFEDAVAGVEAGRRGGFGLVVGVDRGGNASALEAAGADVIVGDLNELGPQQLERAFRARQETLAWQVEAEGFDAAREHTMESLFTVGNGYLGARGALDTPLPGSQCDLFVAGIYDRKRADLPYSEVDFLAPGRDDLYAELVPLPSPFRVVATARGERLDFGGPGAVAAPRAAPRRAARRSALRDAGRRRAGDAAHPALRVRARHASAPARGAARIDRRIGRRHRGDALRRAARRAPSAPRAA